MNVTAELDLVVRPAKILIRLRSGDGRPLRSATIDGRNTPVLEGDAIRLPDQLKGKYRVVGQFDR